MICMLDSSFIDNIRLRNYCQVYMEDLYLFLKSFGIMNSITCPMLIGRISNWWIRLFWTSTNSPGNDTNKITSHSSELHWKSIRNPAWSIDLVVVCLLKSRRFGRESLLYSLWFVLPLSYSASLGRRKIHIVHDNIKRSQKHVNHILCTFLKKTCKYLFSQNNLMFYGATDHLSFHMIYVNFFGTL